MKFVETLKTYWRAFLLLAIMAVLLLDSYLNPPSTSDMASLYRTVIYVLGIVMTAYLADAVDTPRTNKQLSDRIAALLAHDPLERVVGQYGHRIEAGDVNTVWYELCEAMTTSYRATNYGDLPTMYGSPEARAALALQKAKIHKQKNFSIRKVFIADCADEIARSREIREQMAMGITVRWNSRQNLSNYGELKSVDFAIFDDKAVLAWDLDSHRKIRGAWLYSRSGFALQRDANGHNVTVTDRIDGKPVTFFIMTLQPI